MFLISLLHFDMRIARIIHKCKLIFCFVCRIKSNLIGSLVPALAESVPMIAFNSYHISDLKFQLVTTLSLYYKHIHGYLSIITDKVPKFLALIFLRIKIIVIYVKISTTSKLQGQTSVNRDTPP
jgi:hypothetical protein